METLVYIIVSLLISFFIFKTFFRPKKHNKNLPPSPPSVPIYGHLRQVTPPIHRSFLNFSSKYGPIISLRLGSRLVIVVTSESLAQECFTKNDVVLANRPKFLTSKYIAYNSTTIPTASYGDYWRNIRRMSAIEIFSSHRLNSFLSIRQDEVRRLLCKLPQDSTEDFRRVQLRPLLTNLTYNNIMRMVAGKRYYGEDLNNEDEAKLFKELMEQILEISGAGNPGDYLPFMNLFGATYKKKVKNLGKRMNEFLQGLIDEHRNGIHKGNTMIDHLLSLKESDPEYYTDDIIKALVQSMLIAGTDTSSLTVEWALASLLNNPLMLNKVRAEIGEQIGDDHLVKESEIPKLSYLKNVISETFRLYPAVPVLLPHLSSEDCEIGGYTVPGGTILLVNAWAIHRDPKTWEDPLSFKPERFERGEGEENKLMPFGLGRRACPGAGLAQRVIGLTLASLIQCFEWERVSKEEMEMMEGPGLVMPKLVPIEAMCKPRPITRTLLGEING